MELAFKAALTASIVTTLILAAQRFGECIAGLLSGLPLTTAPALLLIGHEHSLAAAADAAVGGIVGCALASLFALAYHAAARRLAPAPTLVFALTCMAAGLWGLSPLSLSMPLAGVVTCALTAAALLLIRPPAVGACTPQPRMARRSSRIGSALAIGLISGGVSTVVVAMNASLGGIIATMPVIGVATAASCHASRGRAAVPGYLRAYVISSLAKAVFCAAFAVCVMAHGTAVALSLACVLGGLVCALAFASEGAFRTDEQRGKGVRSRAAFDTERNMKPRLRSPGFVANPHPAMRQAGDDPWRATHRPIGGGTDGAVLQRDRTPGASVHVTCLTGSCESGHDRCLPSPSGRPSSSIEETHMKLEQATVLITGANRGIGLAFARAALARGARKVYAGARHPATVSLAGVEAIPLDVTRAEDVAAAAARCSDVTLLINNAGIATMGGFFAEDSIESARAQFETNYFGPLRLSRAFAPVLAAHGGGAILNVLSIASWISSPMLAVYGSTKSAAWSLTNGLRHDLRDQGTQVLGMHMGFVDTDMTRGVEMAKASPDEVVRQALDALENGAEEVLADEITMRVKAGLSAEPGVYLSILQR